MFLTLQKLYKIILYISNINTNFVLNLTTTFWFKSYYIYIIEFIQVKTSLYEIIVILFIMDDVYVFV